MALWSQARKKKKKKKETSTKFNIHLIVVMITWFYHLSYNLYWPLQRVSKANVLNLLHKTPAAESLYGGPFMLLTQLIKPNHLNLYYPNPSSFFRDLPPSIMTLDRLREPS